MVGLKIVYVFTKDVDELDARGVAVRFSSIVMRKFTNHDIVISSFVHEIFRLYSPANHFLH